MSFKKILSTGFLVAGLLFLAGGVASAMPGDPPEIKSLGQLKLGSSGFTKLVFDGEGNLYLTEQRSRSVVKVNKYGEEVARFPANLSGAGLAVTPDGDRIYVSGPSGVVVLDGRDGRSLFLLGRGKSEFEAAGDIALDAQGYIFVADTKAMLVKVFDADGIFQYQFGSTGRGVGQFQSIWDLAVNAATNEVYVADIATSADVRDASGRMLQPGVEPKVQVFDLGGSYLRTLNATYAFGTPALTFFRGLAFDDKGRAFVLDTHRGEIRAISLPKTYLASYSKAGYAEGELMHPTDSAFDPVTKRLFVLCGQGRIEQFGVDGGVNPVRLSSRPTRPVPLSPVGGSEVGSDTVELLFKNARDADSDVLTYAVQLFHEGALLSFFEDIPESAAHTSVLYAGEVVENAAYAWEVMASDGASSSGWTERQLFYVNDVEEPPTTPQVLSPVEGEVVAGESLFLWSASQDPDPNDAVRYRVEISAWEDFRETAVAAEVNEAVLPLYSVEGYGALVDGATYFWRVSAIDNHGMMSEASVGTFVFDTSVLNLSSSMPGARVYLGGNYGVQGRLVGQTPLELRDLPPGATTLLLEHRGFEPVVLQVSLEERQNVSQHVELTPAIVPEGPRAERLLAGDEAMGVLGGAVPYVVDFDNDGFEDLLVGDAAGWISLYRGAETGYLLPELLELPVIPGASPFVVDWDLDGRKDLLVGALDGTVSFFRNVGTDASPYFDAGTFLQDAAGIVDVGERAVPTVVRSEGLEGLYVGSGSGQLLYFPLDRLDAAVQLGEVQVVAAGDAPLAPFPVDWDADGVREFAVSESGGVKICRPLAGEVLCAEPLELPGDAVASGGDVRVFAYDSDRAGGKDLVLGDGVGRLWVVRMNGSRYAPSFEEAVSARMEKVESFGDLSGYSIPVDPGEARDLLDAGKVFAAWEILKQVRIDDVQGEPAYGDAVDVVGLLR